MAMNYGWCNRRMIWAYALLWMLKAWISMDNVGYMSTIPQSTAISTSIPSNVLPSISYYSPTSTRLLSRKTNPP